MIEVQQDTGANQPPKRKMQIRVVATALSVLCLAALWWWNVWRMDVPALGLAQIFPEETVLVLEANNPVHNWQRLKTKKWFSHLDSLVKISEVEEQFMRVKLSLKELLPPLNKDLAGFSKEHKVYLAFMGFGSGKVETVYAIPMPIAKTQGDTLLTQFLGIYGKRYDCLVQVRNFENQKLYELLDQESKRVVSTTYRVGDYLLVSSQTSIIESTIKRLASEKKYQVNYPIQATDEVMSNTSEEDIRLHINGKTVKFLSESVPEVAYFQQLNRTLNTTKFAHSFAEALSLDLSSEDIILKSGSAAQKDWFSPSDFKATENEPLFWEAKAKDGNWVSYKATQNELLDNIAGQLEGEVPWANVLAKVDSASVFSRVITSSVVSSTYPELTQGQEANNFVPESFYSSVYLPTLKESNPSFGKLLSRPDKNAFLSLLEQIEGIALTIQRNGNVSEWGIKANLQSLVPPVLELNEWATLPLEVPAAGPAFLVPQVKSGFLDVVLVDSLFRVVKYVADAKGEFKATSADGYALDQLPSEGRITAFSHAGKSYLFFYTTDKLHLVNANDLLAISGFPISVDAGVRMANAFGFKGRVIIAYQTSERALKVAYVTPKGLSEQWALNLTSFLITPPKLVQQFTHADSLPLPYLFTQEATGVLQCFNLYRPQVQAVNFPIGSENSWVGDVVIGNRRTPYWLGLTQYNTLIKGDFQGGFPKIKQQYLFGKGAEMLRNYASNQGLYLSYSTKGDTLLARDTTSALVLKIKLPLAKDYQIASFKVGKFYHHLVGQVQTLVLFDDKGNELFRTPHQLKEKGMPKLYQLAGEQYFSTQWQGKTKIFKIVTKKTSPQKS